MAMWLHISAKNKTNVLQEGLHADSQDGAGFTKPGWQSEPHSPNTNVMCKRWDTLVITESLGIRHGDQKEIEGTGLMAEVINPVLTDQALIYPTELAGHASELRG